MYRDLQCNQLLLRLHFNGVNDFQFVVCNRALLVCHSYVLYVAVCSRMLIVCQSYVLYICQSYVPVPRVLLVCQSYVLECYSYVSRQS